MISARPENRQRSRLGAWLAANGALCAAAAVVLSAYAAHAVGDGGLDGAGQMRLNTAAVLAFGHGVALAALAPTAVRGAGRYALLALYLGVLLFSGSLVFNVLAQWPTTLAPAGGVLLIAGWLVFAYDLLRR